MLPTTMNHEVRTPSQVEISSLSPKLAVSDPGRPLDEKDFWRAKQLRLLSTNQTTEEMLKLPELEKLGEETVKKLNQKQRNILEPLA